MRLRCQLFVCVALLATSVSAAWACNHAIQVRRIALGASADVVHVLEVEVVRDSHFELPRSDWFYLTPRLVELSFSKGAATRVVKKTWPEKTAKSSEHARALLQDHVRDAIKQVQTRSGFEKTRLVARWDCDFLFECAPFKAVDTGLALAGGQVHPVRVPDRIAKEVGAPTDVGVFPGGIDVVDELRIGTRKFYSVTVGSGTDQDPCRSATETCTDPRKRHTKRIKDSDQVRNLQHRRALHHGKEWDVIVPVTTPSP